MNPSETHLQQSPCWCVQHCNTFNSVAGKQAEVLMFTTPQLRTGCQEGCCCRRPLPLHEQQSAVVHQHSRSSTCPYAVRCTCIQAVVSVSPSTPTEPRCNHGLPDMRQNVQGNAQLSLHRTRAMLTCCCPCNLRACCACVTLH